MVNSWYFTGQRCWYRYFTRQCCSRKMNSSDTVLHMFCLAIGYILMVNFTLVCIYSSIYGGGVAQNDRTLFCIGLIKNFTSVFNFHNLSHQMLFASFCLYFLKLSVVVQWPRMKWHGFTYNLTLTAICFSQPKVCILLIFMPTRLYHITFHPKDYVWCYFSQIAWYFILTLTTSPWAISHFRITHSYIILTNRKTHHYIIM